MPTGLTKEGSLTLTVLFCTVSALATSTRRVARVNGVPWDTCESSFIREEEAQLCKRPGAMATTLGTSNRAIRPLTDVSKFLNRYSLLILFGLVHNVFGDHMIGIFSETGFTPRKFFEMTFCRFGPALLKPLPQRVHALARLLNLSTTKRLTRAVSGDIDNPQVNTQGLSSLIGVGVGTSKVTARYHIPLR